MGENKMSDNGGWMKKWMMSRWKDGWVGRGWGILEGEKKKWVNGWG